MPDTAYATTGKFSLTDAAAARISAMLQGEAEGSFSALPSMAVAVRGFQYEFSIDSTRHEDDLEFNSHGVGVVIDEMSLELVDQAELDFVQDLMGAYLPSTIPMPPPLADVAPHFCLTRYADCQLERNSAKARQDHILDFLKAGMTDVLLIQETKTQDPNFPETLYTDIGWNVRLSRAEKL